jgi:hypothetical protein
MEALRAEVVHYKGVTQTAKKQRSNGTWANNILGLAPAKAQEIKDVGTVPQYRHLVEMGVPKDFRSMKFAERVFFRLLSRDDDSKLMFEYQKAAKTNPALGSWSRGLFNEGAAAALAHAGHTDDPRVRGAAHRVATNVSKFLRSELAEKPIVRKGSRNLLHPDAHPPTLFSVAIVAYMPGLRRERAGFIERLGNYLAQPATKRTFVIQVGRKVIKPVYYFLGDPLKADSAGNAKDLPFALHWIELLARMDMIKTSPTAQRILYRLLRDCTAEGVWSPKNLRSLPKSASKLGDFAYPLELDPKNPAQRQVDVTFRLAHIAKIAGWDLEFA